MVKYLVLFGIKSFFFIPNSLVVLFPGKEKWKQISVSLHFINPRSKEFHIQPRDKYFVDNMLTEITNLICWNLDIKIYFFAST